jgi:hypothetical protein
VVWSTGRIVRPLRPGWDGGPGFFAAVGVARLRSWRPVALRSRRPAGFRAGARLPPKTEREIGCELSVTSLRWAGLLALRLEFPKDL